MKQIYAGALANAALSAVVRLPNSLFGLLVIGVLVIFGWTEHDLALAVPVGDRQGLQDHVESVSGLVRECRADCEPKVVLAFALHYSVGARGGLLLDLS